jgi:hypothetical protein
MKTHFFLLFSLVLLTSRAAVGDDSPEKFAKSLYIHSEGRLAGIDLYGDNPDRAMTQWGQPRQVIAVPATSIFPAYHVYEWKADSCSLRVVSQEAGLRNGTIMSIEVWGGCSNSSMGLTGRGLMIGSSAGDAKRVYSPFGAQLSTTTSTIPTTGSTAPTLQIEFGEAGNVTRMKLSNPCVPYCF